MFEERSSWTSRKELLDGSTNSAYAGGGPEPPARSTVTASQTRAPSTSTGTFLTFLYVDARAWPVDVCADILALPFKTGQFLHVACSHVIEHIDYTKVIAALSELRPFGPETMPSGTTSP